MIDLKTHKIIKTFKSISEASREMKISSGNISAVCQGFKNKASGYIWQYADEQELKKYQKNKKQLELELNRFRNFNFIVYDYANYEVVKS